MAEVHYAGSPEEPTHGRPRSEAARRAVLHAVDDMLVEDGYAAMTMKGIAARAGVGKQTVYRWWASKAEILVEACVQDAATELAVEPAADSATDIANYLTAVIAFLTESAAGAAYRALLGEAQHDRVVADLLVRSDVLASSAEPIVNRVVERGDLITTESIEALGAELVGPVFFRILTGRQIPTDSDIRRYARQFLIR